MKYIECPNFFVGNEKSLFLAGGISNCPDWQKDLIKLLQETNLVLMNPRRKEFDINQDKIDEEQIAWEYTHLKKASAVSFWFPEETLCPITLYELGKESNSNKIIFIGINPNYKRRKDVEIQMKLIRPEVKIAYSLSDLAKQIKMWEKSLDNDNSI